MNWNTYLESESLTSNVRVSIFDYLIEGEPAFYPLAGQFITVEYPSGARAKGVIKSISSNEIQVEVDSQLSIWKLIDTNKENHKITLNYVVI